MERERSGPRTEDVSTCSSFGPLDPRLHVFDDIPTEPSCSGVSTAPVRYRPSQG